VIGVCLLSVVIDVEVAENFPRAYARLEVLIHVTALHEIFLMLISITRVERARHMLQ
jgi:hypothetical protein